MSDLMDDNDIKWIVEALLMSSGEPLTLEKIASGFEEGRLPSKAQLQRAVDALAQDYKDRSIELKQLAGGYCLQTKVRYSPWIARLLTEKPAKYSNALLEVLTIIAYKQPVTRADIEDIRGVAVSSNMIRTLLEREWVHVVGYRDVPGKPAVYATTRAFLDYFNLVSLNDLPQHVINHEQ